MFYVGFKRMMGAFADAGCIIPDDMNGLVKGISDLAADRDATKTALAQAQQKVKVLEDLAYGKQPCGHQKALQEQHISADKDEIICVGCKLAQAEARVKTLQAELAEARKCTFEPPPFNTI